MSIKFNFINLKKISILLVFVFMLSLFVESPAFSDSGNTTAAHGLIPRAFPNSGIDSFSFHSAIMDRAYDVIIRLPKEYHQNPERNYPALVVTDGNRFFSGVQIALMGVETELKSPMIVIAIGSPFEEGDVAYYRRRVYEFSPADWDMKDEFGKHVAESCVDRGVMPGKCTGGAPLFLKFIVEELLPELYEIYRIDSEELSLGGFSAGGFFAAWAVFQEASPFKDYVISSPAMAYGNDAVLREEERYASTHTDLNVGIYMSSGGLEIDHSLFEGLAKIVSGQARLSGVLRSRQYPSLKLYSEIHQGLGHVDTLPVTFARGLRLLFGKE